MRLPPFKLERYFARYEFTTAYLLSSSDCESVTVREILEMEPGAKERLLSLHLGYTESSGSPALRREISRIYQKLSPDRILVHTGAEEAIFLFMQALLQAGDHLVVQWPCYQSLFEIARTMGCAVTLWEAREGEGWALDPADLPALIRPRTRAIILNTPHNPTGYLMPEEIFRAISDTAADAGIVLFSDEVYRELEYAPEMRLPAACDLNDAAVSLGVMSKSYGLPGLRIGWIATRNQPILDAMAGLKDYTTICNSAPGELLAEIALRHRHQLTRRSLGIIQDNLDRLDAFFETFPDRFRWQRPKAGPIAFPRLMGEDVETFCSDLVRTAGVLLLPGTLYDHPGNHFRIGFGRRNLPEALERLEGFCASRF